MHRPYISRGSTSCSHGSSRKPVTIGLFRMVRRRSEGITKPSVMLWFGSRPRKSFRLLAATHVRLAVESGTDRPCGAGTSLRSAICCRLTSRCFTVCRRTDGPLGRIRPYQAFPCPFFSTRPSCSAPAFAVRIRSPGLERRRATARETMGGEFSKQDSQGWRPHVTIQNKFRLTPRSKCIGLW
jgi:hypothetical protein